MNSIRCKSVKFNFITPISKFISSQKFILEIIKKLNGEKKLLIKNQVCNTRKKQRRQLERERLAKEFKKINKPEKLETCHLNEL
jgi:hypothetical protein